MNLLWDISLLDERICNVEFLDGGRFLLVTDMFIRSYQMTLLAGGDVARVQVVCSARAGAAVVVVIERERRVRRRVAGIGLGCRGT